MQTAIPYENEHGEYFDFHSLRHQTASMLAMNLDTLEAVRQKAMRHKTPEMTRHYSKTFEDQQRQATESVPDLTQPSRESQLSAKSGTDEQGVTEHNLPKSCSNLAFSVENHTNKVEQNIGTKFKTAEKVN